MSTKVWLLRDRAVSESTGRALMLSTCSQLVVYKINYNFDVAESWQLGGVGRKIRYLDLLA